MERAQPRPPHRPAGQGRLSLARVVQRARQADAGVFTPQFLVNGSVHFNTRDILEEISRSSGEAAVVDLALEVEHHDGELRVRPQATERTAGALEDNELYVAVFENGLVSEVAAGENQGRLLHHDYVVRELLGPLAIDQVSPARLRVALGRDWQPARLGVAAFLQHRHSGEISQAVSLPLSGLAR